MLFLQYNRAYLALIVTIVHSLDVSLSQDIIGCGGFVKSEVEINFSLIEVKLYTKQGSMKYQTDCAPNNGYYMIPVYDKGNYVLRVEPPPGWTFEPESIDLHIDGQTDPCSKSQDLNFIFTGFGVVGRVMTRLSEAGPTGVTLTLKKASSQEVVKQTTSGSGGHYTFEKVLPGEYVVEGSHPVWKFQIASSKVSVGRETGKPEGDVTVSGFDVRGRVLGEGEPVQGVDFLLYSKQVHMDDVIEGCDKEFIDMLPPSIPIQAHCHVKSDEHGNFVFDTLPCGKYRLVPYYNGETVNFDVVPTEVTFTIDHNSVEIKQPFQVTGFSVDGRIMNAKDGHSIADAKVLLDGKHVDTTGEKLPKFVSLDMTREGWYTLKNIKTGSYVLDFQSDEYFFNTTTIKVSPTTPRLPIIYAARFLVCGQVTIDKIPDGLNHLPKHRKISFRVKGQGDEVKTTMTREEDGSFCTDIAPGEYIVKVALSEQETKSGLKLSPASRTIQVKDEPINDLKFSQFRAQVTGRILCLESCGPLQVTLAAVGRHDDRQTVLSQTFTDGSRLTFDHVMPGKYKVSLQKEEWCWKKNSLEIDVTDHDINNVVFTQTGYILSCSLSHDITLNFAQENKDGNVGSFDLTKGVNKFCLSQPGVYKLSPVSCHQFEHTTYQYDTSSPRVLSLTAVSHKVEGSIVVATRTDDIMVTVSSSVDGTEPTILGPLTTTISAETQTEQPASGKDKKEKPSAPVEPSGPFTYKFLHWAKAGEKITFEPTSKVMLFYPSTQTISVQGDSCTGKVATFEGKEGMFLSGDILPKLAGVNITIHPHDKTENNIEVITDQTGSYRVGPLHSDRQYDVSASKEGYVMSAGQGKGDFNAFKLAEINVQVVDEEKEALAGVLLSLSGGDAYRSNNLTIADGTRQFLGLGPGQYYLRPMMKEYQFEPASQMIKVEEGATLNIDIKGTRVAFSCYGSVTSLNGEAEPEVYVEAVGQGSADCEMLQEDTKTEQDGSFRIRGLQPKCDYLVRLRSGDVNQHIERAAPQSLDIKISDSDLKGIHIIAFRRMNQLDLSGNVVTKSEYLPTLKVHLYRETNLDAPLHSTTLGAISFFYLPSLKIDNENYILKLESSLSKVSYEHESQEVMFVANTTYKHFTFNFHPKRKSVEQELSQGSILALPLTILAVYVAYHYKTILPELLKNIAHLKAFINKSASGSISSAPPSPTGPSPIEIEYVHKKQKLRKA